MCKLLLDGGSYGLDCFRRRSSWRQTPRTGYPHRGGVGFGVAAAGMTIDEIVKEYPSLTEQAVCGTLEELAHSELLAPSENPSRREHS